MSAARDEVCFAVGGLWEQKAWSVTFDHDIYANVSITRPVDGLYPAVAGRAHAYSFGDAGRRIAQFEVLSIGFCVDGNADPRIPKV